MSGGRGLPRREGGRDGLSSAGDPRANQKRSVWRPRVTTGQAKCHQGNATNGRTSGGGGGLPRREGGKDGSGSIGYPPANRKRGVGNPHDP
jgi:hypothetical protein